ncbi:MAG: Flp pilus assembly complex ATPase component TadA [Gemmatimonadetes bacterium]|nr:Flp pilus assembly complex ATPase component TadA [Gemmatimonadota bacterium]
MTGQTRTRHWLVACAARAGVQGASALELDPDAPLEEAWKRILAATGLTEGELAAVIARSLNVKVADFESVDARALEALPEAVARRYLVFPLRVTERRLIVAAADPMDPDVESAVAFASGRQALLEVATPWDVREAIDSRYAPDRLIDSLVRSITGQVTEDVHVLERFQVAPVDEREIASEAVVRLTNLILVEAVRAGASDVHIEPDDGQARVRFRIDGVLSPFLRFPIPALVRVVSRIKVLAKLDIADRLRPQDGHVRLQIGPDPYDLRVSTVATPEAEKCVVRILPPRPTFSLEGQSFPRPEAERLRELLGHRSGIVVVTGPTGSGKTTTLYAALRELSTSDLNISTVEDPIEYKLQGIAQIQVEPKRGITFASTLRALLRQDPDVILVGEIRDLETAETAVRAGMTGHLVLTTLHTNDAVGAVQRLVDMGLDHADIASTLRGVIAQRLARRLCPECAVPVRDPTQLRPRELRLRELYGVEPACALAGCRRCRGIGYQGRLPVAEVLPVTAELAEMIGRGAPEVELRRAAVASGMRAMGEVAFERVRNGETTLEEVERVLGSDLIARASPAPAVLSAAATAAAERPVREDSIAVLPFVNLSGDEEDRYFSDGITDDIIAALSGIRGLNVMSRTSVTRYRERHQSLREVGHDLGVANVLEGSVRRAGNRIRIVAQLYDARTDEHLWGETYDRELVDIFEIQSEVARQIARALEAELSPRDRGRIERRPTDSLSAYDLYLRGRYMWNKRTEQGIRHALDYFEQALVQDPRFTLAFASQADAYVTLGIYGVSPPDEVMPLARQTAEKALAIDAGLAEALTALASAEALYYWDWQSAMRDFARAIVLSPGYPTAHQWYALNCLAPLGRFEEARAALARARALDPLSLAILSSEGFLSFVERSYGRAAEELERVIELDDSFAVAHYFLGQVYVQQLRHAEAVDALRKAVSLSGGSAETESALGHALGVAGREDEARQVLDGLASRASLRYVSPALLAHIHIGLGDPDAAFQWLRSAVGVRALELVWLKVRPAFDPLREDPRFSELVAALGFPE